MKLVVAYHIAYALGLGGLTKLLGVTIHRSVCLETFLLTGLL